MRGILGLLVVLAFAGAAVADDTIEVKIALAAPNAAEYANVFVAQELGYYAEEGLSVEITGYNGGGAAQQALASGEGDMLAFFPPGVMGAVAKGVGEKIVGGELNTPTGYTILVRADSDYQTMADLDGKKVAVSSLSGTSYFLTLAAAAQAGVTIEAVPVGGGYLPALVSGEVDAIYATATRRAQAAAVVDVRVVSDLTETLPNSLPAVWVASDSLIAAHPEAVEGVLRATYRAIAYMKANPDYAIAFIKEFSVIEDDALAREVYETTIVPQSTTAWLDPAWIEASRQMAMLGGGDEPPPAEAFFTDRFGSVGAE